MTRGISAVSGGILLGLVLLMPITSARANPNWYNDTWARRTAITIDNTGNNQTLTDYQVKVTLNESTFDFGTAKSDLTDVRFTDTDGTTPLSFWKQSVTQAVPQEVVGDWYQGPPYSQPAATYPRWVRPMAQRYEGINNRSYFVYGDANLDPAISYYDHATTTFAIPVRVDGTPLPTDAHGNPSLLIDHEGYLYIFYGSHTTKSYMRRSVNPEDISSWTDRVEISGSITYPQPHELSDGNLIVFFRKGTASTGESQIVSYTSSDRGSTWSGPTAIVSNAQTLYSVSAAGPESPVKSIHLAFMTANVGGTFRENIHYLKSTDGGSAWTTVDGTSLSLPVEDLSNVLIVNNSPLDNRIDDVVVDSDGNPHILYLDGEQGHYSDGTWHHTTWNGSDWIVTDIADADVKEDAGAIIADSANNLRVYIPSTVVQSNEAGGEIVEWSSSNGGANWTATKDITTGSTFSHTQVKRVLHADPAFELLWSYGDATRIAELGNRSGSGGRTSTVYYYGSDDEGSGQPITYTPRKSAEFWVSIPIIPAGEIKTFYLYHGNNNASDASSGTDTFHFFDDAESGAASDKWEITNQTPTVTYHSSDSHGGDRSLLVSIDDEGTNGLVTVIGFEGSDYAIDGHFKIPYTETPTGLNSAIAVRVSGPNHYNGRPIHIGSGLARIYQSTGTSTLIASGDPATFANWREWSLRAFGTSLSFAVDGNELVRGTDSSYTSGKAGLRVQRSTIYGDNIRLRSYSEPEPGITLGSTSTRSPSNTSSPNRCCGPVMAGDIKLFLRTLSNTVLESVNQYDETIFYVPLHKPTVFAAKPVDADQLHKLTLRINGKVYNLTDPDRDLTYTVTLPAFVRDGRYPYALTADYGVTTYTEHGVFIVGDTKVFPLSELNHLFRLVFGRDPTFAEWEYWATKRQDKPERLHFLGAMQWQEMFGN